MQPNEGGPRREPHREGRRASPTLRASLLSNCLPVLLMGIFVLGMGALVYLSLAE